MIEDEDFRDEMYQRVDQPLGAWIRVSLNYPSRAELAEDETKNCPFLKCEYNRDGDSFRCARGCR